VRARLPLVAALALAAAPWPARGDIIEPFKVSCSVSVTPVVFGFFDGRLRQAAGGVRVTCTGNGATQYSVAFSTGSSGTYATRTVTHGSSQLHYNLFTDPNHQHIWGDGTGGSSVVHGLIQLKGNPIASQDLTIYGELTPGQTPTPGLYADQIVVTMTY
jgi:spore coat protein U-like protein